jgi:hypothetical protein
MLKRQENKTKVVYFALSLLRYTPLEENTHLACALGYTGKQPAGPALLLAWSIDGLFGSLLFYNHPTSLIQTFI